MTSYSVIGGIFDWLSGETWRPLVAMLVGAALVVIVGWLLARRIRKEARGALGMAWMVGGVLMVLVFLAAAIIDGLAVGAGSAVERALLGWFPGVDALLPLGDLPAVGALVYLVVLLPLYSLVVWLIWWSLVSADHLTEDDRAQSRRWLYALAGRGGEGALLPGFVRWFKPLLVLLSLVLATALLQLLLSEHPPHPAAWVTAGFFVTGSWLNLRAPRSARPPASDEEPAEPEAASSEPEEISRADVEAALSGMGLPVSSGSEALASTPGATRPLSRAHPVTRAFCHTLSSESAPWSFQSQMVERVRGGEPALVVGPHGAGRSSGLALAALDATLSGLGTVLVVAPSVDRATAFAGGLRSFLATSVTPEIIRVAAGLQELAEERQAGHDAAIFVTTAKELRREVASRSSLTPVFYRGLGAVLIDDLELFGPEAVTALRLALHELRAVVASETAGAAADPTVLATTTKLGTELEPWASDILGERVELVPTSGAPLGACDVVMIDSEAPAPIPSPVAAVEALVGLGFTVEVHDEVHSQVAGRPSFVSLPCWELDGMEGVRDADDFEGGRGFLAARSGSASSSRGVEGAAPGSLLGSQQRLAKLLFVRRADAAFAVERHRPVGLDGARLLVVYVLDRDGASRAMIDGALKASRDVTGSASAPLRLIPRARAVPDVVRRHLIEAMERPRRLDWLRSFFPAKELDALFDEAGGLERLTTVDRVLAGEPPELVDAQVVTVPNAAELAKQPYWRGSSRVPVRATEDGEELFSMNAELAKFLLPIHAAFVVAGRRWEVVSRDATTVRATRRRSPNVVVPVTNVTVEQGVEVIPDRVVTFGNGATLSVGAHEVTVQVAVTALERRHPDGHLLAREELSGDVAAQYTTYGVRLSPAPSLEVAANHLTVHTTLDSSELVLSRSADVLWILDHGAVAPTWASWLEERIASTGLGLSKTGQPDDASRSPVGGTDQPARSS